LRRIARLGTAPFIQIAEQLGIDPATAKKRIRNLLGVLAEHYRAVDSANRRSGTPQTVEAAARLVDPDLGGNRLRPDRCVPTAPGGIRPKGDCEPMRLYTVCVESQPILVMSADADTPMLDAFTTIPELMKANRDNQPLWDETDEVVRRLTEQQEIEEAVDTWLGEDLMSLTRDDGRPLWNGDRSRLAVRDARTAEATEWHIALKQAIDIGEENAGTEDFALFLIPVNDAPINDNAAD
jgi:hypothetical protein